MRYLPAIVSGPGRWVLPFADRSAALVAEFLLADRHAEPTAALADVLASDPPLVLWALALVAERRQADPASVSDVAAWLAEHVLSVLQWPEPNAEGPPGRLSPEGVEAEARRSSQLVGESLCMAAVAAELASGASPSDREQAVLMALVHNAPAWFARPLAGENPVMPATLSRWLAERPEAAVQCVRRAAEILAGKAPPSACDVSAVRRRAEQRTRAWAASIPGAGRQLRQLTVRLARLELLERRFLEKLEYEKLEAMAELAAGAGHEINNPLAIIAGRAQLFLHGETDPERRREAAIIVAQVKRAHEMIADMRLFARPPKPEPQEFDLASLVDGLLQEVAPQAAERATTVVRSGHPGPLAVELDPVQMSVAVHALIRNALEAMGHGGQIEVGLDGDEDSVRIRVADNGPGVSPEHRSHIFDPFFSARQAGRGLGMGLSKCWRIVTNHRGRVEVTSPSGPGAVFVLHIPRRLSGVAGHETRAPSTEDGGCPRA